MYGKKVEGTIRSTFIVGADGKVEKVFSSVKVPDHVDAVLAALDGKTAEPKAKAAPKAKASPKAKAVSKAKKSK